VTLRSPEKIPLENRLIGDILKEYPQMSKIMKGYFGGRCLEGPGFRIQTVEMACILFGVDQKKLLKELEELQN
jgi:hypothetical protein